MIDEENLRTASLYINNQLLSRGLLRDGQNIDFADPEADDGLQGTMGKIMGVVNDLILRRDRDAVQRESLSNTLLSLRADNQRHTTEASRLSEKLADTQRKLDGADAVERTLRLQVKTTEATVHKLKDEITKTRSMVAQGRAACANEVRKRDRQIESLKKAVIDAGRVRGGNKSRDVVSITVIGEVGAETDGDSTGRSSTDDERYSLRMETNEFLTELAKSLSEENSTLLNLVHRTVENLREMSGLQRADDDHMSIDGRGAYNAPQGHRNAEELASELEGILEHLRTILTNPSFVPIEEVEIRDSEIARLREGWERMEARWKDAVDMMDGWRRRMASSGKPVGMEELQMGMRLSPVRITESRNSGASVEQHVQELSCVQEEDEEEDGSQFNSIEYRSPSESLHLVPAPGHELEPQDDDSDSSIFQDDVDMDELEVEEPNVEVLQESLNSTTDSPPLPIPPHLSPLKDSYSSANRGSRNSKRSSLRRSRRSEVNTTGEEASWETTGAVMQPPAPPPHGPRPQKSSRSLRSTADSQETLRPSSTDMRDSTLFGESYESPIRSNPTRKLFSGPPPKAPEFVEPKSHASRDIPRSQQPTASSSKKQVAETVTAIDPPKQTSSTRPPRKAAKRMASAPDATKKQPSVSSKPTSKSTGLITASNGSVASGPVANSSLVTNSVTNGSPARPSGSSRLSRTNAPPVQPSPITMASISAKLEASERQADAARVRAKLKAARTSRKPEGASTTSVTHALPVMDESSIDPVKRDVPPAPAVRLVEPEEDDSVKPIMSIPNRSPKSEKRKREKRPSKAVSRRRSTLSPWELESLIQGQVDSVPSPAR